MSYSRVCTVENVCAGPRGDCHSPEPRAAFKGADAGAKRRRTWTFSSGDIAEASICKVFKKPQVEGRMGEGGN